MSNEELVALIENGEGGRLEELWNQVERFVAQQANRRMVLTGGLGGVTFDDLYHSGFLALVSAVDTFDPDRGMSFIGWLSMALKTAFAEAGGYRSSKQARDPLHQAGSLDVPLGDEAGGDTLGDIQPDPAATLPFEETEAGIWRVQLRAQLEQALDTLPTEQADILRRRFYQGQTFQAISEGTGLTPAQARQREGKGLRALRHPRISRSLETFLEERTPYYLHVGAARFNTTGSSAVEEIAMLRERLEARAKQENVEKS